MFTIENGMDTGHLLIEGSDASSYLQRMVTNDVASLKIGEGQHNALLDRKGMVLSLFYLLRTGESCFHAIIPFLLLKKTEAILKKTIFLSKVTLTDVTEKWGLLKFIGQDCERVLSGGSAHPSSPVAGGRAPDPQPPAPEKITPLIWKDDLYPVPVWNLLVPKSDIDTLKKQLALPEISKTAFDLLRMKAGIPEYGIDIDETHLLLEANLAHTYKRQKGCYPGQEVVERILAYGQGRTPKKLCSLYIEGDHKIAAGTPVYSKTHEKIGETTSALYDPTEEKTILLAYLEFKYANQAKELYNSPPSATGISYPPLILRGGP